MNLSHLRTSIEPLRQALLTHPLYADLRSMAALRVFMQYHVFAVWDFMSLLKALQRQLCCVSIPWRPPVSPSSARMINEIVLGEETDADGQGGYCSHFELYHRAMIACGASTAHIDQFQSHLAAGESVAVALGHSEISPAIQQFVHFTFGLIEEGHIGKIASAFTFGREDLLPDVFQKIVDELSDHSAEALAPFQFYLHRHMELDGEQHGPMAEALMAQLCGTDKAEWEKATTAAVQALQVRLNLWDGIHAATRALPQT